MKKVAFFFLKMFNKIFSIEFLLKILIITAIIFLMNGQFNIYHWGSINIGSGYGGFEIKNKE